MVSVQGQPSEDRAAMGRPSTIAAIPDNTVRNPTAGQSGRLCPTVTAFCDGFMGACSPLAGGRE